MKTINTKTRGIQKQGLDANLEGLKKYDPLTLIREPLNPKDKNAIKVLFNNKPLGYVSKEIATDLAPLIDKGEKVEAWATEITGQNKPNKGLNITIRLPNKEK